MTQRHRRLAAELRRGAERPRRGVPVHAAAADPGRDRRVGLDRGRHDRRPGDRAVPRLRARAPGAARCSRTTDYTDANAESVADAERPDDWLVYNADMAQPDRRATRRSSASARPTTNEQVNPTDAAGAHELGDVWNTQASPSAARNTSAAWTRTTAPLTGWWRTGDATRPTRSTSSTPRSAATCASAPPSRCRASTRVIALYDGENGAPLRKIDTHDDQLDLNTPRAAAATASSSGTRSATTATRLSGDGCSSTCTRETGRLALQPGRLDANDGLRLRLRRDRSGLRRRDALSCDYCGGARRHVRDRPVPDGICAEQPRPDQQRDVPAAGLRQRHASKPGEQCDDGNTTTERRLQPRPACGRPATGTAHPSFDGHRRRSATAAAASLDPDCADATTARVTTATTVVGGCHAGLSGAPRQHPSDRTTRDLHDRPSVTANPNDRSGQAMSVDLDAGGTAASSATPPGCSSDVPANQLACGAANGAPDAIFQFRLRRTTKVEIDASNSANTPVLALFDAARARQRAGAGRRSQNDDASDADLNPAPTPQRERRAGCAIVGPRRT